MNDWDKKNDIKKKIISLGGNYFQKTLVQAAKELGVYVIDVDYLPNNPAHKYADEYHNISTLDKDAVLQLAREKRIDGIISYASDVSAPTAAFIAETLGLPGNPLSAVNTMADKSKFHPYLRKCGFYMPRTCIVQTYSQLKSFFYNSTGKIMVKPSHGSGSKGVSIVDNESLLKKAWEEAVKYSDKDIIAEDYIQRVGHQIAGDAFVVNGKVVFFGTANEHFDDSCNPLVPVGESFPANIPLADKNKARNVVQRALNELGYKNGAVNLDFHFTEDNKVFLIELGPRNGGNLISDAIKISSGVDLAKYTVLSAVGEDVSDLSDAEMKRFIGTYIWHSNKDGVYKGIKFDEILAKKMILSDMFVKNGDTVRKYINGSFGIGAALIEFDSMDEMVYMMDNMNHFYQVILG